MQRVEVLSDENPEFLTHMVVSYLAEQHKSGPIGVITRHRDINIQFTSYGGTHHAWLVWK